VTLKSGSTDLPVTPIVDLNDIEIDLEKPEIILPSVSYDTVFEALEISPELLSELEKQGLFYEDADKMHIIFGQGALGPYTISVINVVVVGSRPNCQLSRLTISMHKSRLVGLLILLLVVMNTRLVAVCAPSIACLPAISMAFPLNSYR